MARKRLAAEQTITKLRQIEMLHDQGRIIAMACTEAGTIEQKLRFECLNGEIFFSFGKAKLVIENRRIPCNTKHAHSALGYLPPAPLTIAPKLTPRDEASLVQ